MSCILLADGNRVDAARLRGNGLDGFIISSGCHVLKIPKLYGRLKPNGEIEADRDNHLHVMHLEAEKKVYGRLRGVPGVAECIECTNNGILLKYYPDGSLDEYISRHEPPPMPSRWRWILEATEIIARCHERGVLIFDIALRNFLLADDSSLRIIDFANSTLVPQGTDITHAKENGCTALLDLLHLSNVIYSIMTWQKFSVECAIDSEWPDTDQMPDLKGLDHGWIVDTCWNRKYRAIQELVQEMRECAKPSSLVGTLENQTPGCNPLVINAQSSSPVVPPA